MMKPRAQSPTKMKILFTTPKTLETEITPPPAAPSHPKTRVSPKYPVNDCRTPTATPPPRNGQMPLRNSEIPCGCFLNQARCSDKLKNASAIETNPMIAP